MLNDLKFVKGAVGKKNFTPVLSHFRIKNGRVTGSNGALSISSQVNTDIEAYPVAAQFVKAIETCKEEPELSITKAGRLAVKAGTYRAYINCTEDVYPNIKPEGEEHIIEGEFVSALEQLRPFIGTDASRKWCNGILMQGDTLTVTNNIIILRSTVKNMDSPSINISATLIDELIRAKITPTHCHIADNNITFHYENGRWIKSTLLENTWPTDTIDSLLSFKNTKMVKLTEEIFDAVEQVLPLCDESRKLFITGKSVSSSEHMDVGARVFLESKATPVILNVDMFHQLRNIATKMNFKNYPDSPCSFIGKNIKGCIVGIKI